MKKFMEALQKCPLFAGIEEQNLLAILNCLDARTIVVPKNDIILHEGDDAKNVGIILSGEAQIVRDDYYGNRCILTRISPGELFGETFACAEIEALPVSVIATKDSEVMMIDCHRITKSCHNACEFHNKMIFNLLKVVSAKNMILNQKIEVTSKRSTREKLMAYLLQQAKLHNCNHFSIPYSRQELADFLEVDRSGLSAEISKLRKEAILNCRKNEFTLL